MRSPAFNHSTNAVGPFPVVVQIAVGSSNPVKVGAAHAVLEPLYPEAAFSGLDVPSGVRAQPWGDSETRLGAINRARAALSEVGADLGVGLEGGVIETESGVLLCNWAAIIARDGRIGIASGGGLLLPSVVVESLRAGMELGPAMDALTGEHDTKHGEGAVGLLTAGLINRQGAFTYALTLALAPFRTPHWYGDGSAPAPAPLASAEYSGSHPVLHR